MRTRNSNWEPKTERSLSLHLVALLGILFLFVVFNMFFNLDGVGTVTIPSFDSYNETATGAQPQQLSQQPQPQQPQPTRDISAYRHLLPQRIYSVIGLESSGTRFVTGVLSKALGTGHQRNGVLPAPKGTGYRGGTKDVWVQHLSIPWGGKCQKEPIPRILPVILPGVCSSGEDQYEDACRAMARDANMTKPYYPKRWLLDMIQYREFYESVGVRMIYVVITRDTTIARKGRVNNQYCTNETLLLREEEVGTDILKAAIRKYLLQDGHGNPGGSMLTGNDFVLISYESLMRLGDVYIEMLFQALGIESDYRPEIADGNPRYVVPN